MAILQLKKLKFTFRSHLAATHHQMLEEVEDNCITSKSNKCLAPGLGLSITNTDCGQPTPIQLAGCRRFSTCWEISDVV